MATEKVEYFTDMLDHLDEYNDRHGQILSSKNLKEDVDNNSKISRRH